MATAPYCTRMFLDVGDVDMTGCTVLAFEGPTIKKVLLMLALSTPSSAEAETTGAKADALMGQLADVEAAIAAIGEPAPQVVFEDIMEIRSAARAVTFKVHQKYSDAGRSTLFMKPRQKVPDIARSGSARKAQSEAAARAFLAERFPDHLVTFDSIGERKHDVADSIAMARYMEAHPDKEYSSKPDHRALWAATTSRKRRR